MRVVCIGGGPAGLYFALLLKKARPDAAVAVIERNRAEDTFGFGVVFSDATLGKLGEADRESYDAITRSFSHWDDIRIHFKNEVMRSRGHGFSGLSRKTLLAILQERAASLGVELAFEREVKSLEPYRSADLVVVADGVNSAIRAQHEDRYEPSIDLRPNRFVWLGTTYPFDAFTFYFRESEHGLFQVHAYRYAPNSSTFIIECSDETFRRAGLDPNDEDTTIAYCEKVFAAELAGHRLLKNRSIWRNFPTVTNRSWHFENVVLVGDAAHTAHFSIGSGTKLAMEDAIALRDAVVARPATRDAIAEALTAYEGERRPIVESTQRAAQVSLEWFESTSRYLGMEPLPFAFSLLTRSLRVTHDNLRRRDPEFVARVDRDFADGAARQARAPVTSACDGAAPPPMLTPFRLRDLVIENRVVLAPTSQYLAEDGVVGDWHLVHLGSRAVGGAGLLLTEMAYVSRDARATRGCAGMYADEHVAAWRRIVSFVHEHSAAKIGVVVSHAGRRGAVKRPWEGDGEPLADGSWALLAPSPLPYAATSRVPKAMDRADMDRIKADFVRAAARADDAGFDLLELQLADGHLLASFISPLTNRRTDDYGGPLANRMRYPLEIVAAVRAAWPAPKPMAIRISATDGVPGGLEAAEAVEIARMLKEHGCDIVEVSSGQTVPEARRPSGRSFGVPFSDRIRHEAEISTMAVGGITSAADVNSVLAARRADLCVLERAHVFDPYWTRHAAHAQKCELAWPEPYRNVGE